MKMPTLYIIPPAANHVLINNDVDQVSHHSRQRFPATHVHESMVCWRVTCYTSHRAPHTLRPQLLTPLLTIPRGRQLPAPPDTIRRRSLPAGELLSSSLTTSLRFKDVALSWCYVVNSSICYRVMDANISSLKVSSTFNSKIMVNTCFPSCAPVEKFLNKKKSRTLYFL